MEKVKVKIAVAINSKGEWGAHGCSMSNEANSINEAGGSINTDFPWNCYMIEVDIPKPSYIPMPCDLNDIAKR